MMYEALQGRDFIFQIEQYVLATNAGFEARTPQL
jgi:hypothetical protein